MSPDIMERTLLSFERLMSLSALSASINESDVPGIVIEVGVYRGGSAMFLSLENLDREVHVFDTFAGIPGEPWELDGHKRGDFAADYEDVAEFLKDCHNVKIYRGVFPATLPKGIGPVALAQPFDRTDCSVPMRWATKLKVPVDTFVVYTDSETWSGNIKPVQALRAYRESMGIDAKLVVVGMVSNGFTIADPTDAGMLDVVGFDTATPNLISDFSAGKV